MEESKMTITMEFKHSTDDSSLFEYLPTLMLYTYLLFKLYQWQNQGGPPRSDSPPLLSRSYNRLYKLVLFIYLVQSNKNLYGPLP